MEQFGVLTLGSRLKRLSDHLFAQVQEIYQECDVPISSTYFPILKLLQTVGGLSVVEIAERLNLSHPAVSKQTTKMLKEELLEKISDEQDHRRSVLRLSPVAVNAMKTVEPILIEMKVVLEQIVSFQSVNFMASLAQLETAVLSESLARKVIERLRPIQITPLSLSHHKAFHDLNMAWLVEYFPEQITPYDKALLENPQQELIGKGAFVWVAVQQANDSVVGTIVLKPTADGVVGEILKLAVDEQHQGKGIAQTLLHHVIAFAESQGMMKLTLETASCLKVAKRLYDKNGFVDMVKPEKSDYERADVYMEKELMKKSDKESLI